MNNQSQNQTEYEKWGPIFHKISVGLFIAIVCIELAISLVLYFQDLIFQDIGEYMLLYLFRPIAIGALILIVGGTIIKRSSSETIKFRAYIVMITMLFGNIVFIHNLFMVAFFIFCIPIYLTVILQDKKLLYLVTILSCGFVIFTSVYSYINQSGAANSDYYIPSVIIVTVILVVCMVIARTSIDILIEKNEQIISAMEEAQAANKSKSIFLSSMSHEIRTPINAILGMDEMIIREASDSVIKDYAYDIQTSGRTLLGLVNDILDFSKIEAGKLDLIYVEYEVSSVVRDLLNSVSKRAYDKGLSFSVQLNPDIPKALYGDEVRIKQIILNLLTNAVKYTDKGSINLNISYEKYDDNKIKLLVSVADTGQGIKSEELDKLFTPFERLNEKANRKVEGTGLGMAITRSFLQLMGSELKVESEWQKGSVFSFELVQEVRSEEKVGDYNEALHNTRKEAKSKYQARFTAPDARILVIDDVSMNLKVIKGLLKKTQIQLDMALSGPEGIELTSKNKYDVIFIDHMMPEMDGIETLDKMNSDENNLNKGVAKVALTANAISGSREFYLNAGFKEYLSKPVEPAQLENLLLELLPQDLVVRVEEV